MRLLASIFVMLLAFCSINQQEAHAAQKETKAKQQESQVERPVGQTTNLTIREPEREDKRSSPYDAGKDCLYRVYLVFAILGVLAGVFGIIAIYRQTKAIAESTSATKEAAQATRDSVRVQEAGLRQWLNIDNWQVWMDKRESRLRLRFSLTNASTLPLTLHTITENVVILGSDSNEHSEQSNFEANVVAPENPYIGDITMPLSDEQSNFLIDFPDESAINLFVSCEVIFTDVRGKRWKQIFDRAVFFGKAELFGLKEYEQLTPRFRDFKNILREEPT
jgi:hypothetical protein